MAIKTYRPITPTLRFKTTQVNDDLTTDQPHKPLLVTRNLRGQNFDSDVTVKLGIARAIHFAHVPGAKRLQDLIRSQAVAGG